METNKIVIPDGCKAEIRTENGQQVVIIEGVRRFAPGETFFMVDFDVLGLRFYYRSVSDDDLLMTEQKQLFEVGNYFNKPLDADAFCNDLNKAIKPLFEKAIRGEYDNN